MNTTKKNVRLIVITLIVSLSLLLQGCNFHDKVITPWQELKGIPTNCSALC